MALRAYRCSVGDVDTYSIHDAARILKVSPARLLYWERTDLVAARTDSDSESGAEFEFRDLVHLKGILSLLDQGVSLRRIRRNVEALREHLPEIDDPVGSLRVWAEGSERVVIRHGEDLIEPEGQAVLDFGFEKSLRERNAESEVDSIPIALPTVAAEEYFERGCQLDSESETFDEAIECYLKAIELAPDFADCHCNLGAVYYNGGQKVAARRCFERCLEIDHKHVEANFNLANLLEEVGCDEMALHHYRCAFIADPLYSDLHINLALLYEKMGQVNQARRHWKRYLQLDAAGSWAQVARRRLEDNPGR